MALMPTPKAKPEKGLPGQLQNMEEWNAFTGFASGTSGKAIGFGHPVSLNGQAGDGTVQVKALADGEVFAGITRENISTSGTNTTTYGDGDRIGIVNEGVIFVLAGGTIAPGNKAWFNPADNKYYGSSAETYLPLPDCEFDQSASADEVVPLRLRLVPGGDAVAAVSE